MKGRIPLAVTVLGAAIVVFLAFGDVRTPPPLTLTPDAATVQTIHRAVVPSASQNIATVQYEEIVPFLEAVIVAKENGAPYLCTGKDNFDQLSARNPLLEALARNAMNKFLLGGHAVTPHLGGKRLSPGASPWGVFSQPEVKEEMLPFFEAAKQDSLTATSQETVAAIPTPPPS